MAMAAMLPAGCTTTPAPASSQTPGAVPVLDVDFADPFVLPVDDGLVAYATNTRRHGHRINVQVSRSSDGLAWTAPAEAMPTVPPWALPSKPDIWAPEAIRIDDRYVLYFSARHATRMRPDGRTLCVGVAVATAPEGPFVPQAQPLTCGGEHGVIDASPFRDDDGALWLYVKTDGNCCDTPTTVLALRLATDGLHASSEPVAMRGITNDLAWEGRVVEAQQMVRTGQRYRLFYAGNDYGGADYAIGYANCEGPAGPCRDAVENPILRSDAGDPVLVGPGHPSVFEHDGHAWITYHGWRQDRGGRYRSMYIHRLDWVDGRPVIRRRQDP